MTVNTRRLVPMAFVADVPRSINFYRHLGFSVLNSVTQPNSDVPTWAWLESGDAHLMVAKAGEPVVPEQQAVLFYLYVDDVGAARDLLLKSGLNPGPIATPFYAPRGEFRLVDPDGYCLMITHL
jgi:catechol 2,3-dioxygenase-like lactoylglutathione lyase family enzyme